MMNKRDHTTIKLDCGQVHIYDFGSVRREFCGLDRANPYLK